MIDLPSELVQLAQSSGISQDSIENDEPVEFVPNQEMMQLMKLMKQTRSSIHRLPSEASDETLWSNMYAIRELPATIKVRAKSSTGSSDQFVTLYCENKGKEVVLNNGDNAITNRFYIKILPPSVGILYLIYSTASQTPLCVGHYLNRPDEKILMSAKDNSTSQLSVGWDLIPSSYSQRYYSIQNEMYLGQSDPENPWSIFNYVLEAVSGNKIRYAQRIGNKPQQEFIITPDAKFEIKSLEYDLNISSCNKSYISKVVTKENSNPFEVMMDVPFDFYETETSSFSQNAWNVNLQFSNNDIKFVRPSVLKGIIITANSEATPDALFINRNSPNQSISRHVRYVCPIRCKPRSIVKVVATFVKYNITVGYTVKAQYQKAEGDLRECILKGTWTGSIIEDPSKIAPECRPEFIPLEGTDIILKDPVKDIALLDTLITVLP